MSQPTIEQFSQEVMQDPTVQHRLQSAPDQESLVNSAVAIGQEKGYSFSTKEVEEWLAANQSTLNSGDELNDAQLEAVAGGKGGGGKKKGGSSNADKISAAADVASAGGTIAGAAK